MIAVQIILAILLTTVILLQQQGSGLGTAWGGSGTGYHTRQGIEKFLFRATILLILLFIGIGIYSISR